MKNVNKLWISYGMAFLVLFALLPLVLAANDTTGICTNTSTNDPNLIICDDFTDGLILDAWTNISTSAGYVQFQNNAIRMKGTNAWDVNTLVFNSDMPRNNVTFAWNCSVITNGNTYTTLGQRSEYTNGLMGIYRNTGNDLFCQALDNGVCTDFFTDLSSTNPNKFAMQIGSSATDYFNITLVNNNSLQSNGTLAKTITTQKFQWNTFSGELECYGFKAWVGDLNAEPLGALLGEINFVYPSQGQSFTDYNGDLNFTTTVTTDNCALNSTDWTLDTSTASSYNFVNTTGFSSGSHSVEVICEPLSGDNFSSVLLFSVDNIAPVFVTELANNITDQSYNVSYQINITEANPNNFSLVDSCGNSDAQIFNTSVYVYNQTYHLNGCGFGTQYTNVSMCDDSGNCEFKTYQWNLKNNLRVRVFDTSSVLLDNFTVYRDGVELGSTTSSIFDVANLNSTLYNISVFSPGFANQDVQYTMSSTHEEYNFSLFLTNTFNMQFLEEVTNTLISGPLIEVQLISNAFGNNYTTTNGTLLVSLLVPDAYTIRSSADGYLTNFKTVLLNNNSLQNFTIYMSNATTTSEVTVTVIDELGDRVEGAYIETLRYDPSTNTYKSIEVVQTNFEGQNSLNLEQNGEFYKFIISFPFGTARLTTTPTQIFGSSLNFQINLADLSGSEFFIWQDVSYSLSFGNTSNTFTYTFTDPSNSITQGCLDVYKIVKTRRTQINESCVIGTGGSINILISPQNGTTYIGKAYITSGGTQYLLEEKMVSYGLSSNSGKLGVLLVLLLTMMVSMAMYWDKTIALIITPIPAVLASITGLWDLSLGFAVIPLIFCVVVALYINRGGR